MRGSGRSSWSAARISPRGFLRFLGWGGGGGGGGGGGDNSAPPIATCQHVLSHLVLQFAGFGAWSLALMLGFGV